jgi:DNA-binding response OmpR family regulator
MPPPYHVIIADDDDGVRGIIARVVVRTYPAVSISALRDGQDALDLYDQRGADLLITNNDMPRVNGLELLEALRIHRQATLPIIMISADASVAPRARLLGVTRFVAKPFALGELVQVLSSVLPP